MASTPRGIRLNNPGNLRHGPPWQGLSGDQPDQDFAQFVAPHWGIRAMAKNLIAYQDRHGIHTIRGIISRWAPAEGQDHAGNSYSQDTDSYIRHIASRVGVLEDQWIDVHQYERMKPLVEAMILHENGMQPYTNAQIDKGLLMAGIEPPQKPAIKSRTVQGGTIAGVSTLMATAQPALPLAQRLADSAPLILGLIALAGIGYMLYARWDDRKKGLR